MNQPPLPPTPTGAETPTIENTMVVVFQGDGVNVVSFSGQLCIIMNTNRPVDLHKHLAVTTQ